MNIVLVTAIGTAASTTIVKELRKAGQFHIIGADMIERHEVATSLDVDEYFKFPPSISEEYISFALDFCKNHKVDYYFAIIDDEVVNLTKNRNGFVDIGTKLCLPDYNFTRICHYKELFADWIEQNIPEIAIKQYKSFEEAKKASYPLFLKPNEGAASRGVRIIKSYDELISAVKQEDIGKRILIQDYIEGIIVTVDCIRSRSSGQELFIPRKELHRNTDGCGIAVEVFYDENLSYICKELVEGLDLNGVVNIEFFATHEGYKIVEINPRHSAGVTYSCMAGADMVLNAIRVSEGQPCIFGKIAYGSHYAKRYEAYRMD